MSKYLIMNHFSRFFSKLLVLLLATGSCSKKANDKSSLPIATPGPPSVPTTFEHVPDKTSAPVTKNGLTLVWNEEFAINAASVNRADWNLESGFVRNQELQWYKDNTSISNHLLVIEGKKETIPNPNYIEGSTDWRRNRATANYTSSSITTMNKHEWKYGRFEIRAKIPTELGSWPAIWTLGKNNEWPSSGEIDILELYRVNNVPTILANFAWGTNERYIPSWDGIKKPLSDFVAKDPDWINKFHIWRMDWDANNVSIYLDDLLLNSHSTQQANATNQWGTFKPFDQPHYLLLNLAIGSNGGSPSSTEFPLKYYIDYVRVYQ